MLLAIAAILSCKITGKKLKLFNFDVRKNANQIVIIEKLEEKKSMTENSKKGLSGI